MRLHPVPESRFGFCRLVYDLPDDQGQWKILVWGRFGADWTPWAFQLSVWWRGTNYHWAFTRRSFRRGRQA